MSRRSLLVAGAGLALAEGPLTASQVIEEIKKNVGVPWRKETVDRVIIGDPETPAKGIATTMMATTDVIERAARAGKNLVITHEPTFWLHQDTTDGLAEDPAFRYKTDFIKKNNVVVFRFHDHWHAHQPDGIATGMMRELGWMKYEDPQNVRRFSLPGVPLLRLVKDIQSKVHTRTMRVIGDPDLRVSKVAANWGYLSRDPGIQTLGRPDVDVLICGEAREWEVVEYAQDLISAGQRKGLILMGHVASEQAGMKYCAEWLKTFLTTVPIEFMAAGEPMWGVTG